MAISGTWSFTHCHLITISALLRMITRWYHTPRKIYIWFGMHFDFASLLLTTQHLRLYFVNSIYDFLHIIICSRSFFNTAPNESANEIQHGRSLLYQVPLNGRYDYWCEDERALLDRLLSRAYDIRSDADDDMPQIDMLPPGNNTTRYGCCHSHIFASDAISGYAMPAISAMPAFVFCWERR